MANFIRQLTGDSPFRGTLKPSRVPLFDWSFRRKTAPFPHPGNYQRPIDILEGYFAGVDQLDAFGRHNRYLDFPGWSPVLVTRDPAVIRAITVQTGDKPGQFDRDTMPSKGIARATGPDTLLYSNGSLWRHQRRIAASPFGKTTLFQPEKFHEFEIEFRKLIEARILDLHNALAAQAKTEITIEVENEIKPVMLELLTNCFFGTEIDTTTIREVYTPALQRVIDHIVRDTICNPLGLSADQLPPLTKRIRQVKEDCRLFDELTQLVLEQRSRGTGLWNQFRSEAPDEDLESNIKVFLAGALEATTSFACWAIAHLARHPQMQEAVSKELELVDHYTPDELNQAVYLGRVLEETLRLTPSLYFLPRRANAETTIQLDEGQELIMPAGTHVLLDVWHANRVEEFWGSELTGFPADQFQPDRWLHLEQSGRKSKDFLHFGFGHGPRVCPGKHLGLLEVGLVVGGFVKAFRFSAETPLQPRAGVSTKPADGTLLTLSPRKI